MTITEAQALAHVAALVDRIKSENPGIAGDVAFREVVRRRWIVRVGLNGPEVEFTSVLGGRTVGWKLTARGNVVADETLTVGERAA